MAKKKNQRRRQGQQKKRDSYTPLWVRIVAVICAVAIVGTAIPLAILFFH